MENVHKIRQNRENNLITVTEQKRIIEHSNNYDVVCSLCIILDHILDTKLLMAEKCGVHHIYHRLKGQTTIYKTYIKKTKDRVTRTPLKTGGELRCSGRVIISCSTYEQTENLILIN
jgi:hypothetical protein